MRKITSFLLGLFCLCGTAAWAQPQGFGDALIYSAEQLSSPYSDSAEGTDIGALCDMNPATFWHSDWHGEKGDDGNGRHYLQIDLTEPMEGPMVLWIQRRAGGADDHPTSALLTGSLTEDFVVQLPIATITLGNAAGDQQFVTEIWTIPTPVRYIRFTPTDCAGSNNYGFRKFWHAAEINLYRADAAALVENMMMDFLNSYDEYLWAEDFTTGFNIGTEAGQYTDTENAQKFFDALTTINGIVAGDIEQPSDEEIKTIIEEAKAAYETYLESQVEFVLPADGYYRIVANLEYKKVIDTGQVDEFEEPITETITGIKKSMYSMLEGFGAWHTYDATDCRDIWHLTRNAEDNTVNMINAATEMGFWKFGNPVYMSNEPDSIKKIKIDWAGKENDRDILYFRPEPYNPEDGIYFHQLSHGRGTGEGDKLCTWNGTFNYGEPYDSDKGTSEWYLEPVSEAEALQLIEDYAMIKDHDLVVIKYKELLAEAKSVLAVAQEAYRETYITRNDQFSSMVTETAEGSINNLLDGDYGTFWHSAWQAGQRPGSTHFLDVIFDEPVEGDIFAWIQRRRGADNDHPTVWTIYGSNDEAALQSVADFDNSPEAEWAAQTIAGWTLIADDISTPIDADASDVYTPEFNVPEPYKYMRFVCKESLSKNGSTGTRGYFHMGGFQIYKTIGKPQIEGMGEVGTTMAAQIEKADNIADADITLADYNALEAAYEAFVAILKDPRDMRNAVAKYKGMAQMLVIGEEPSQWPSDVEAVALDKIVTEANEYDKGGVYDQAKLDEYTAAIEAAAKAFQDAPNKISTAKWYRFRFPTEETYAKYGWSDSNVRMSEGQTFGDLFGQYVAVSNYYTTGEYEGNPLIAPKETEEIREGDHMRFTALDNIQNDDAALFRFVPIGDTAYIIQNKATGLYINCAAANNTGVTMSLNPTTFTITAAGYGGSLIHGKSLAGVDVTYLHAQRADHRFVTWNSSAAGSNSSLWIETVADVEGDAANLFIRDFVPGKINTFVHPAGVKLAEESDDLALYTAAGTFQKDEKYFLALNKIQETQPGVPYIAIVGTPEDFAAGEDIEPEPYEFMQTGAGFAANPDSINGLKGTYVAGKLGEGLVNFIDNTAVTAEDKVIENEDGSFTAYTTRDIAAHKAYLKFGKTVVDADGEYDLVIEIGGSAPTVTAIRTVMEKVTKTGAIYDMNGRLVKENGNMNDVKRLGRGIYILNGVKVSVK